jgi:hypothetical protein
MGCFALLLLLVWISDVFVVLGVSSNQTIMAEIAGRRLARPVKVVDTVGLKNSSVCSCCCGGVGGLLVAVAVAVRSFFLLKRLLIDQFGSGISIVK